MEGTWREDPRRGRRFVDAGDQGRAHRAESGEIVATGRAGHTVSGTGGARESDPRQWWRALRAAIARTGRAGDIGAISVGGQQHGLVVLDARGRPLRKAMLWNDTRSGEDARRLVRAMGAEWWAARTGSRPVASFTATKWAWLRRVEPSVARAAAAIRLPHDYLTELLAGRGVTDRGDASGTCWWSTADESYADDILALPGLALPRELLPIVLGPGEEAGKVTAAAARELGLLEGVVVGPGTGDNMAAALGLGLSVGQVALSLGTSGTVYAVSARRPDDVTGIVAGFADAGGRFLPLAATLNCTLAVDRVARWLRLGREKVEPSGGVVALPFFDGERTPDLPLAPATLTGLRGDTTPRQILMAVYEGAAASLIEALDAVAAQAGGADPAAPLVVIGGGSRGAGLARGHRPALGSCPAAAAGAGAGRHRRRGPGGGGVARGGPAAVARRWGTGAGALVEAVPRDEERLARIRAVREVVARTPALSRPHG